MTFSAQMKGAKIPLRMRLIMGLAIIRIDLLIGFKLNKGLLLYFLFHVGRLHKDSDIYPYVPSKKAQQPNALKNCPSVKFFSDFDYHFFNYFF